MNPIKSWGEPYIAGMEHSSDANCSNPSCDWKLTKWSHIDGSALPQGWCTYIIGFSIEVPRSMRSSKVGGLIIECPKCFTKYFYHVRIDSIEMCKIKGKWPTD